MTSNNAQAQMPAAGQYAKVNGITMY